MTTAYNKPRCNCPDATGSKSKNLFSGNFSETFDRDWSTNFNGIRAQGGYCEHEIATINYRKEIDQAFPQGIPYKPRMNSTIALPKYKPQTLASDGLFV